ncbi:MAG: APC family permease, partial [Deltaproteobacteria bacterium]|nr:APC family permease [Deltaproteobacteria bacterium]
MPSSLKTPKGQIAVATTVMLTFISFWRAAAIVLNDMGSSAYYVPGIAEQAIGKAAPWFLLGVMLFSYVVRLVYMESTMIFMRGGMYPVVRSTLGGTLAKLSVSALLFDFVLTGPISTVSAGQYIVGLFNQVSGHFGGPLVPQNLGSVALACAIILYFWRQNIRGIEESSGKALKIMQFITIMVVILVVWGIYSLTQVSWSLPPFQPQLMEHSVGWLKDLNIPLGNIGILIAIGSGHCFLAMSGQETFAQVSREIAHPKLKNLKRAGFIIFIFCFVFMVAVAFFATMLIPDEARSIYYDNLIIGIVNYFTGPEWMKLGFQGMVVIAGFLILAGASNTALIGSNSIVNAVCEDGVLTDWFRKPHPHYGTTHRIINSVAILQIVTILLSGGNVYLLGEAYAFGVLWSFVFETLAVIVLRYKRPEPREWKFPVNLHIGKIEIPIGLLLTFFVLLAVSVTNLFTKQISTLSGVAFTIFLFTVFTISEQYRKRKATAAPVGLDPFRIHANPRINRA